MTIKLNNEQQHAINAMLDFIKRKESDYIVLSGAAGTGKAQPLSEPVLTPFGFKPMGEIQKGDFVISEKGLPVQVLNTFESDNLEMYELTFSDGSTARCCKDHLWEIQTTKLATNKRYRVMPLKDMLDGINAQKTKKAGYKYRVRLTKPVEFQENKNLLISPWSMGYILGNGSSGISSLRVSIGNQDIDFVSNSFLSDEILSQKTKADGVHDIVISYKYRKYYESIGLWCVKSVDKWIPDEYKYSSVEQRKLLLAGLMDSDGCCNHNKARFSSSSKRLIDDVSWLVRSLGGIASGHVNDRIDRHNIEYGLQIRTPFNPFSLPRKAQHYKVLPSDIDANKRIVKASYLGVEKGKCISIDNPSHLYLTNDFTVTHNTSTIQYLLDHLEKGTRVVFTGTTNKCTRVLKNMSIKKGLDVECVTIHSLLGLSMRTDSNGKESLKSGGKSSISKYDLLVVDECSMINTELLSYIHKAVRHTSGVQVIFMGDANQLNPVGEGQSPVFAMKNQLKLTTVMRQSKENPILALCTKIRENIDNGTYNVPEIVAATSDKGDIGVHVMNGKDFSAWMPSAFNTQAFDKNTDSFRVVAWRNDTVNYYNSTIQKIRYPDLTMPFAIGESVVFSKPMCAFSADETYSAEKPVSEGWDKILCSTESEGVVKELKEVEPFIFKPSENQVNIGFNFRPFVIKRHMVTVELHDGTVLTCAIAGDKKEFKSLLEFVARQAKNNENGMTWFVYFAIQRYFTELRSIFCITAHKSQGSTYGNCFVDTVDILSNPDKEEALRCLYVACSRATSNLVLNI